MQQADLLKEDVVVAVPPPAPVPSELADRLRQLSNLSIAQLRSLWQRHYQVQVPKGLSRDLLVRFVAHRLQEDTLGRLSKATLRRFDALRGRIGEQSAGEALRRSASLKPGTTLLREWNGTTHTVLVRDDGFEYRSERYASLTKVAAAISGLHRSGPAFFGLKGSLLRFAEQGRGLKSRDARDE